MTEEPKRFSRRTRLGLGTALGVIVLALVGALIYEMAERTHDTADTAKSLRPLPEGALECAFEGTDASTELGQLTPGPASALGCEFVDGVGMVPGRGVEGDLTSFVDLVNAQPLSDAMWGCGDVDTRYDIVLGYSDGHTEVVALMTGNNCDVMTVNQKSKTGATGALDHFLSLLGPS